MKISFGYVKTLPEGLVSAPTLVVFDSNQKIIIYMLEFTEVHINAN